MSDEDLEKIKVPLAQVRARVVELMKTGQQEISLRDLLYMLRDIHREFRDEPK